MISAGIETSKAAEDTGFYESSISTDATLLAKNPQDEPKWKNTLLETKNLWGRKIQYQLLKTRQLLTTQENARM